MATHLLLNAMIFVADRSLIPKVACVSVISYQRKFVELVSENSCVFYRLWL